MPARSAKKRRKSRKQRGGTRLTNEQINFLGNLGFTDEQKNALGRIVEPLNDVVTNMLVTAARDDIRRINPQTGVNFTPQNLIDNIRNTVGNVGGGKRRKKSRKTRKTRKQIGGTRFSEAQLTELGTLGFNDEQKNALTRHLGELPPDNAMGLIRQSLQQINPQTGQPFTPQGLIDSLDEDDDEEPMTPPPRTEGGKRRRKSRKQRGGTDFTNVRNELNNLGIVEDDDIRKITQFYTVGPNDAIDTIRNYLRITYPGQAAPYTQAQIRYFIQTLIPEQDNDLSDIENDSDDEHNIDDEEALWNNLNNVDGGRRRRRKTRKQRGGTDFNEELLTELGNLGFTDDQKTVLSQFYTVGPNDAIDTIRTNLQIRYPGQIAPYTQAQIQAFIQTLNNNDAVRGPPQQVAMPVYGPDGGRRRKTRKTKKLKPGARDGPGVVGLNFDPNYSIYNTRELTLFPYNPN